MKDIARVRDTFKRLHERLQTNAETVAAYDAEAHADAIQAEQDLAADLTAARAVRDRKLGGVTRRRHGHELMKDWSEASVYGGDRPELTGTCVLCGQHLTELASEQLNDKADNLAARVAELDAQIAELCKPSDKEVEIDELLYRARARQQELQGQQDHAKLAKERNKGLKDEMARVDAQSEKLESRLRSLPVGKDHSLEEIASVVAKVGKLERTERALARVRETVAGIEYTKRTLAAKERELADTQTKVKHAEHRKDAVGHNPATYGALCLRVDTARKGQVDLGRAVNGAKSDVRLMEQRVESVEAILADYERQAAKVEIMAGDLATHAAAEEALVNLRRSAISGIRPELEDLMTGFLHTLTDGRHDGVQVQEDFSLKLFEGGMEADVVSGGTEDVTALALRLAIGDMIAQRSGSPLSLLVLDEPFGSLDEGRRANVLDLIRRLRDVYPQVVLISHVAETRDAVDHPVRLKYDETAGYSRVVA